MKYNIVSSCSTGNAVIIEEIILIDCGVSFKKLEEHYKKLKIVLLTHIHSDHFNRSTIRKLSQERPALRFGCCKWLVKDLLECGVSKKNIDVYQIGITYDYKLFKIMPLRLYHDVPQCGYRLFMNDKKLFYATDTKTLEGISAKKYDLYLIEGNYDEDEIKERIKKKQEECKFVYEFRAENNHLSKQQASEFLLNNMGENSKFIFMHEHIERTKNGI